MPLPVAHGLLGATVVAAVGGPSARRRRWSLLIGAVLAICPDLDFLVHAHRTFTHSLPFAVALTAVLVVFRGSVAAREATSYGLAFMSHGLLDYATSVDARGVQLLWPFSRAWLKLEMFSFSEFRGAFPLDRVIERSAVEALVFTPLLLAALILARYRGAGAATRAALRPESSPVE